MIVRSFDRYGLGERIERAHFVRAIALDLRDLDERVRLVRASGRCGCQPLERLDRAVCASCLALDAGEDRERGRALRLHREHGVHAVARAHDVVDAIDLERVEIEMRVVQDVLCRPERDDRAELLGGLGLLSGGVVETCDCT